MFFSHPVAVGKCFVSSEVDAFLSTPEKRKSKLEVGAIGVIALKQTCVCLCVWV